MPKSIINFIFSMGYRCYSPDFLNSFKLRKMSGPFDYLFIDFETSLKIINNNFDDYLHDIVLFNKNTTSIDDRFYELLHSNIGYMAHNYNSNNLLFNQNYLDNNKLDNNLYKWDTICSFHHHDILDNDIHTVIKTRCDRFNNIMNKYSETCALLHITKIINCKNITDYMDHIVTLKTKYDIKCFVIVIVNCSNIGDNKYYNEESKCLFIVKKVENYGTQYTKYQTDNNLNYKKEFDTMSQYFTFDLIEKNDI